MSNKWRRLVIPAGLVLAWTLLAAWQYHEYRRERELARETLRRQAHSVLSALIGGIRTHRGRGPFFLDQLQDSLTELANTQDVLAASVISHDETVSLSAGDVTLLTPTTSLHDVWQGSGLQVTDQLRLADLDTPGHGQGGGQGGGRRWSRSNEPLVTTPRKFTVSLLLDRSTYDVMCRQAIWLRGAVTAAGAAVIICVALAWLATVRMVRARAHTQVLESQAKHLHELNQAAAGLAHETRNPLGVIRGCTQQLARADQLTAEQQRKAQAVVEECDRVTARINQFLAFARPPEPQLVGVEPASLIDELAVLLQSDLEAKQLTLKKSCPSDTLRLVADPDMLRQALFNLIQNAIEFSPHDAVVDVQVDSGQDGTYRIDVSDQGPGIAQGAVESLFTPYYTTRPQGTGLGLAIVRRIANVHGWNSRYLRRPDGGSIFRIEHIRSESPAHHSSRRR